MLKVKQCGVDVEKRAGAAIGSALKRVVIAFSLSGGREGRLMSLAVSIRNNLRRESGRER